MNKIIVFGKPFDVVLVDDLKDENGEKVDGLCDPIGFIYICSALKGRDFWHTLLHEIGHARDSRISLLQTDIESNLYEIMHDTLSTVIIENFDIRFKDESNN